MELVTFQYQEKAGGWSVKNFPLLDSPNTLVLVFAAPEFIDYPEPLYQLAAAYPQASMIGCSSAGEIAGSTILDHSISVAVIRWDKTRIVTAVTEIKKADESYIAGEKIADLLTQEKLKGIFVLSDGLNVNGTDLVRGLNTICKDSVVVTGGLAGDGDRFKQTWLIYNGKISQNAVVAVGFYGDHVRIKHGSRGGWDIFGPERRVTHAISNVLYELDNKPALALYKEYLGERASGLPATGLLFPLAIRKNSEDSRQLVRTILAVDEKNQSLTFAGDIPVGYLAQLMRANFDRLITGASEAGQLAVSGMQEDTHGLAVAVSCVGRRLLLGDRTEEETESTLASFPKGMQQIGFYSYGELSPYATGSCDLHNQTMTLTILYEE